MRGRLILLRNCRLANEITVDILIKDGKIKEVGKSVEYDGKTIDVKEKFVLPGLIDPHVHFRYPGGLHKEEWETASAAAVKGGYTTVIDMPNTTPSTVDKKSLEEKKEYVCKHSLVNFGFHLGLTNENVTILNQLDNVPSYKLYMGSTTGSLLVDKDKDLKNVFKNSSKLITIHAENEDIIKQNEEKNKNQTNPFVHAKIRSSLAAKTAVEKAIKFAKKYKNKVYICHTSTTEELELISKARKEGVKVYCEATPHHLFMEYHELERQGNFAKMNPPLRRKMDVEALWMGINKGVVDTIGTDHAPHTIEEKEQGYWKAPSGVPGIENALALMLDAVNKGKISLKKVEELMSTNPARIFDIKNKGKIKKGCDADLVIIDMDKKDEIQNEKQLTKCKWSPYDGKVLKGWSTVTIVGGNIVYDNGNVMDEFKGKEVVINAKN
ncbi:dihydroorotase family protein [Candidatus Woesearchaeota archaeon]|nr:dihydroorotase family protein [Candidatus Woesearchaeota archaeon]